MGYGILARPAHVLDHCFSRVVVDVDSAAIEGDGELPVRPVDGYAYVAAAVVLVNSQTCSGATEADSGYGNLYKHLPLAPHAVRRGSSAEEQVGTCGRVPHEELH